MAETSSKESSVSFVEDLLPKEREELEFDLKAFGVRHASHHRPIALVTSGGTAADLEVNSVRCLDNFSTGLRGAISVEEFLQRGYAVIHLSRVGSASPYGRVLSQSILGLRQANHGVSFAGLGKLFAGDKEEEDEDQLVQSVLEGQQDPWLTDPRSSTDSSPQNGSTTKKSKKVADGNIALHRRVVHSSRLQTALKERAAVIEEGRLLTVSFRSVEEYIAKLQLCAESVRDSQALAIFYLAAAVSDFYIPKSERSQHKIQSQDGGLALKLSPVPKVMGLLRSEWAPDAFVCSFKLETDKNVLRHKAERAVQKYDCHMVIGNLLHTRHDQVWILAPSSLDETPTPDVKDWPMQEVSKPRASEPDALESLILEFVVQAHFEYISTSCNGSFDKSGTEAVIRAHEELEEKKRQVRREIFWKPAATQETTQANRTEASAATSKTYHANSASSTAAGAASGVSASTPNKTSSEAQGASPRTTTDQTTPATSPEDKPSSDIAPAAPRDAWQRVQAYEEEDALQWSSDEEDALQANTAPPQPEAGPQQARPAAATSSD